MTAGNPWREATDIETTASAVHSGILHTGMHFAALVTCHNVRDYPVPGLRDHAACLCRASLLDAPSFNVRVSREIQHPATSRLPVPG